jgi:hypothetical protein
LPSHDRVKDRRIKQGPKDGFMLYRLRQWVHRSRFDALCKGVLATQPLRLDPTPLRVVSMVSHRDLLMYLVAIKTFGRQLGRGVVTPLNDGSLTAEDEATLRRHLPGLDLRRVADIDVGRCPRGGCWERLTLICDLARENDVIQLDSDTLCLGPIPEVEACLRAGASFTMLGGGALERVESFAEASERARKAAPSGHVQAIVERGMADLPDHGNYRYIRGNAAFAGFVRGSFTRQDMERYSETMISICGREAWNQWGSEQVTSNLVVANSQGGTFLPQRRYCGYYPERDIDYAREPALIHFIGLHRYEKGFYARLARRLIEAIRAGHE